MRAAVYLRQSLDQNDTQLAVARQRDDCLKLCAGRGWAPTEYVDNNVSATRRKPRPAYQRMLADIRAGLVDAVFVWDLDRLYRHARELEDFIDLADAHRLSLATVTGDVDLATDNGRLFARIKGAVAKAEGERKAARFKRSMDQKAAAGRWHTANRPFGYAMDGEPLEPEASMIRQAVADVLTGKSIKQVAREWNAAGITGTRGNKFTAPNVRRLLGNPRYAALRVHRGKIVGPGDWPALIDVDTHHGLVAFLGDPSRIKCTAFEKRYQGSGVYTCGICGAAMRHAVAGGRAKGYRRYECAAGQHVTRAGVPLDHLVTTWIVEYLARPDARLPLVDDTGADVAELQGRRAGLQARLDELAALFADGAIDGSQLRRGTTDLRTQLAGIDAQLAELTRVSPAAAILAEGAEIADHWHLLTDDQRMQIIGELIGALSPDMAGKLITELCTVVVRPTARGGKFNPADIDMIPREQEM